MARNKRNNVYVVETRPGHVETFDNWPQCQAFVRGKSFPFAGGVDREEALAKMEAGKKKIAWTASVRAAKGQSAGKEQTKRGGQPPAGKKKNKPADYPVTGICADAGTHGNPGPCEYQVADLNGVVLAHKHLGVHSNNFAELAGIGAMIQYAVKNGQKILWTDSSVALAWIRSANPGPTVRERPLILKMVEKIRKLLADHPEIGLRKWKTRQWGEIPADFGRK